MIDKWESEGLHFIRVNGITYINLDDMNKMLDEVQAIMEGKKDEKQETNA